MELSVPEMKLEVHVNKRSSSAPVPVGPPPPSLPSDGVSPLLSNESSINADEEYSHDEVMLNEFIKLHPMLRCVVPTQPRRHHRTPTHHRHTHTTR